MYDLERLTNQYSEYKFSAQASVYFADNHLVCASLDDLRERQIPEGTYCMVIGDMGEPPVIRLDGFLLGECIAYENRKFCLVVIKNQDHRVNLPLASHDPVAVQGVSLSLICNDSPLYLGFLREAIDHYREALVDFDHEICVAFFGTPPTLEGVKVASYPAESFHMAFARNRSMELCSRSHILMTDLDCYLSRRQVGELVGHLPQTNGVLNFRKPVHPFPGNGLWLGESGKLRENGYCEDFEFFYYEDTEFLMNFSRIGIVPHSWFVDFEYVDHSRKRGRSFWHNKDLFLTILKQGGRPDGKPAPRTDPEVQHVGE